MNGHALPAHRSGGASSLIGDALIDELHRRKIGYASSMRSTMSATSVDPVTDEEGAARTSLQVIPVSAFDFSGIDLARFFAGVRCLPSAMPKQRPRMPGSSTSSAAFRGRESVPLIVADVNAAAMASVGQARSDCVAGQRERGARHGAGTAACPSRLGACGGVDLPGRVGQRARRHG